MKTLITLLMFVVMTVTMPILANASTGNPIEVVKLEKDCLEGDLILFHEFRGIVLPIAIGIGHHMLTVVFDVGTSTGHKYLNEKYPWMDEHTSIYRIKDGHAVKLKVDRKGRKIIDVDGTVYPTESIINSWNF